MLSTALITFTTATAAFLVVAVVVRVEHMRDRRLFLSGARGWLDVKITTLTQFSVSYWNHFVQYILKLGWYYSIHSLLRTILNVLVSVYAHVEAMFERNRRRTKQLRMERKQKIKESHLTQIAAHKEETALTPSQQTELRRQKLEQDQ
jgi:ATP-dependent helicase/DNAse subunit B